MDRSLRRENVDTSTQVSVLESFRYVNYKSCSFKTLIAIQVIALGSNIGSGLFIGTGKALAYGGPGNMLIAYLIVCAGVWGNVQSLIEMTILYPTSGNFVDYAGRWVDPAVAFGAGFAEWLGIHSRSNSSQPYHTDVLQGGLQSSEARQYSSVS
jgi:amino acid permease